MTDIDKIVNEAEYRHNRKEQFKAACLQPKDFVIMLLMLLLGFSPLIAIIIKKLLA